MGLFVSKSWDKDRERVANVQACNRIVTHLSWICDKKHYLCAMETRGKHRILVVDDESDLCEILKFNLEMEGYEADVAASAEEALTLLDGTPSYDLLLLDVMMSGMSGFSLAHQLKTDVATRDLPIIFLTARDSENDIITGLNLGADDYIAKPFSLRELLARVGAVLRRTSVHRAESWQQTEGLTVDDARKLILMDGVEVQLTRTEFDLLCLLLGNRDRVFSRQELIDHVWPHDVVVTERTVDVCVTRLRKKIGRYATHLITKPGFGYAYTP